MAASGAKSTNGASKAGFMGRFAQRMFGAVVSWSSGAVWRRILLLTLISIAVMAPGIGAYGPTDRDEARFVQATKQMIASGDYVDIRFQDEPRHQKPIGTYWAQAASAQLFGGVDAPLWAYRLPSLIGGILAALLTAWAARPLVGPRAAFIAGAMTAGLIVLSFEARTGKADALLLAAIVAAQGALARLWFGEKDSEAERGWYVFYFWTALAVGFLLKGPIILLPVVGTLVWMCAWSRSLSGLLRLGASWGIVWFLLLVAPWFVAIGVKSGGAYFDIALGEDLLGKVAERREGASLPPGVHLLAFLGTFWPWTVLAAIAIPYVWRWRRAPETAFMLGWIIPTWIVFEFVATKLAHYTLPTYPAMLALSAAALIDGGAKPKGPLFWTGAAVWAIPALALPLAIAFGPSLIEEKLVWAPMPLALGALAVLILAFRRLTAGLWLAFVRTALVGAGLTYAAAYQFGFPALDRIWVSERLVDVAEPWRRCLGARGEPTTLGSVRYHEPSLVFLAGTDTRLLQPEGAAEWLASGEGRLVWVEGRRDEAFRSALSAAGAAPSLLAQTDGFQYNGGKELSLMLYGLEGDAALEACGAPRATQPPESPGGGDSEGDGRS